MSKFKRILAFISTAAVAVTALAGCSSDKKKDESGNTKNDGNFTIAADSIAADMGAGWNLGNTLEANGGGVPSETAWGNPEASQEIIDAVADAGFNTVRIPVSYLSKIDDANGYKVDEDWLNRIEEVVNYCYNKDMYVIINVHGDGYNTIEGGWLLVNGDDQETIKAKYEALWEQIATHFADYDEHLIFESMNEVFNGEYSEPDRAQYENLNAYNQIFVDTVRETGSNNTHRWLLVPGWNTDINYTCGDYGFVMPTDNACDAGENRLMLSVHYYEPWDYCGQEDMRHYLWGNKGLEIVEVNKASNKKIPNWGDETHLESQMQKLSDQYTSKGIPVIIGEYGCIDKSSGEPVIEAQLTENRAYYNSYVAGTAASKGIIPVYWDNGYNGVYGFGLFDRKTFEQTQPEIISAIVNAVKDKKPLEIDSINVDNSSESKATELNAYFGVQTKVYTFRNAHDDATYGKDSEWFNTLIKWGEDADGDGNDDIIDTGATFTDVKITGDGTYTVGVSGYDFSSDCDGLNMLFVSTDIPFVNTVGITDVVLKCDDTEYEIKNPVIMADASGNFYIEVVNIYNTEVSAIDYTMPTDSFEVTFTITGTGNVMG